MGSFPSVARMESASCFPVADSPCPRIVCHDRTFTIVPYIHRPLVRHPRYSRLDRFFLARYQRRCVVGFRTNAENLRLHRHVLRSFFDAPKSRFRSYTRSPPAIPRARLSTHSSTSSKTVTFHPDTRNCSQCWP